MPILVWNLLFERGAAMGLDVKELLVDWDSPDGEIGARLIVGRDGRELVQLRIELGVLQMALDGRPDGQRYHGMTNALEYIEHERATGSTSIEEAAWTELDREFSQYNYRRVALSSLVDQSVTHPSGVDLRPYLIRALSDVDTCTRNLNLLEEHLGPSNEHTQHRPTLAFNRARLRAQLRIMDEHFDEAVEELCRGQECLDSLLTDLGLELEEREEDPGLSYLCEFEQQIRDQYHVKHTLREQLEAAIESEDFESAARLRDKLQRRDDSTEHKLPPPEDA